MSPRDPSHKTANRYSDNETESDDVNCESESLVPRLAGPGERAAPSVSTAVPSLETRDKATVNLMISATVFHFLPGRHAAPLEDNTGDDDTERQASPARARRTRLLTPSFSLYRFIVSGAGYICPFLQGGQGKQRGPRPERRAQQGRGYAMRHPAVIRRLS